VNKAPLSQVAQETGFYCFPACFSSFLKDNGVQVSQSEIIDKCPEIFGKASKTEGAFSAENFHILEKSFPIRVTSLAWPFGLTFPKQSAFFLIDWENKNQWHWVRFVGQDAQKIYLMYPVVSEKPDEIDFSVVGQFEN
jgi:hypothetical protein